MFIKEYRRRSVSEQSQLEAQGQQRLLE